MKTINIGIDNGMFYMETVGKYQNGVGYRKRTNYMPRIEDCIYKECRDFLDAKIEGNDLYLYTNSKVRFVFKDYKYLLDEKIVRMVLRRIEKVPFIANNLELGKRTNLLQLMGLKILYLNTKKIASLALTGTILASGVSILGNSVGNLHQQSEPISIVVNQEDSYTSSTIINEENLENQEIDLKEQITQEKVESQVDILIRELSLESRIEQTKELQATYGEYDNSRIMIGARVDLNRMQNLFSTEEGKIILDVAETYGIDPYLLAAKGITESNLEHKECCPGGSRYNGYGVGAFQIESPSGEKVTAYNFKTGEEDSLVLSMENMNDFRKNATAAAMCLQNRLNMYNGNLYLAIQSYNYGFPMMRVIIHEYAKQQGITVDDVKNNINDLGWLQLVEDAHINPNDYYYKVVLDLNNATEEDYANAKSNYYWKHGKYGNAHYLSDVLSNYLGVMTQNLDLSGSSIITNFQNNETIRLASTETQEVMGKII